MMETKSKSKLKWAGLIGGVILVFAGFMFWRSSQTTLSEVQKAPTSEAASQPTSPSESALEEGMKENSLKVVAFGDSLTAGFGVTLSEAYPAQLQNLLKEKGYRVQVINAGVSGETTAGGLRRADFIAQQKPDIVILALGGNDVLRGLQPQATKAALAETIRIFQGAAAQVILAGMYAPANLGQSYGDEFNALYPALAEEFKVPLIPFLLEGVALKPSLNQADGIHPNPEGAKWIAEKNVLPVLEQVLKTMEPNTSSP